MREAISTAEAPAAIGPYSQAMRAGDFIFTSGQLGLVPGTGALRDGVAGQTAQALDNLAALLAAAGATFEDVVKTTIFLADMGDFQIVNELYGARFKNAPPARSTVQIAALPRGGRVEIEMVAYRPR